jgi:hypothetical protein
VLLQKGHDEVCFPDGWRNVEVLDALGHRFSHDADTRQCMMRSLSFAWRAFWRNYTLATRALGMKSRLRLHSRAVTPVLKFRMPRWIWSAASASEIKKNHGRMINSMLKLIKGQDETWREFTTRRNVILQKAASKPWDVLWKKVIHDWQRHLDRHPESVTSKMRCTATLQGQANDIVRTMQMMKGNRSALKARRFSGVPKQTMEALRKERVGGGHSAF